MDSELVKQIKDLAFELSAPRSRPGRVELRTQTRATKIRQELLTLYNAEPQPTSKQLVARHNGLSISKIRRWKSQTVLAGMLESMIGFLIPAVWGKPSFSDTERETAIQSAVTALPELCEKLQALKDKTQASGEIEANPAPKRYSKPLPVIDLRTMAGKKDKPMSLSTWRRRRDDLVDEIIDDELRGNKWVRITEVAARKLGLNYSQLRFDFVREAESAPR